MAKATGAGPREGAEMGSPVWTAAAGRDRLLRCASLKAHAFL
jgi:hypothetical protein